MTKNVSSITAGHLTRKGKHDLPHLDISSLSKIGAIEQNEGNQENTLDNEDDFINEQGEFSAKLKLYDDDEGAAAQAYHGLVGDIVRTIDPHTEGDPVATLINFLTAYGNIIGDSAHFMAGSKKHPARIFSVVVGATGKGRKGTSLSPVRQLFQVVEPDWEKNHILSGMSSGEGLIFAVMR